jgi:putative transposon-encoded protein
MSSRLNEPRIEFTQKEIETAYQEIVERIGGNKKVEVLKPKEIKGVSYN